MFRFTIRDVLWLTVVVAIAAAWGTDRWRQSARMHALEGIVGLEAIEFFPKGWEGTMAGVRNQNALLDFRVDALTRELESRKFRFVERFERSVPDQKVMIGLVYELQSV